MKAFMMLCFITLCQISAAQSWPSADTLRAASRLSEILQPYVAPLDRDLWTFRYEGVGSNYKFLPTSVEDVSLHIGLWANRFQDPEIISGADTGPGVYVATDPAATATWGGLNPKLFAIKIKQGARILIGDEHETPAAVLKSISALAHEMGCQGSSTSMATGLGNAVGFFRMNQKRECRQVVIQALTSLGVQAISYGFNSVPLANCRVTGTAVSIINSNAISLNELNMYSEAKNLEGQPSVTPFVRRLFEETQDDYYSQSLLENREVWGRYRNAYGFFKNSKSVDSRAYTQWRNENILKCGPKWSIELADPTAVSFQLSRLRANPQVKNILIEMSLIYREKFKKGEPVPYGAPAELNVERIRAVAKLTQKDDDTKMRLFTARVPALTENPDGDEKVYIDLLTGCLKQYETQSIGQIAHGECGVEPE